MENNMTEDKTYFSENVSEEKKNTYFNEVVEKLLNNKLAMAGLIFFLLLSLLVIILPFILNLDPYTSDPAAFNSAPTRSHILGTDAIGRDLFARLIYGGRTSLMGGVISSFISLSIGVPLGLIAGYYKKIWEVFIMRLGDIFLSFPSIILILVLVSVIGPSIWSVTIVLGVLQWTVFARLIYANVLSIKEKEYIEAAKSIGTSNFSIILKYILPNAFPPILITVTFNVARAILSESALSFLGMGVQPPKASWGNMLYDAQSITVLSRYYWVWLPPGLCIVLTVLSINFFGDGIRDALDPRLKIQVK